MDWCTVQTALDVALQTDSSDLKLKFYGGEPLLELPLVRKSVRYVEDAKSSNRSVSYFLFTNGTLLDEEVIEFLRRYQQKAAGLQAGD